MNSRFFDSINLIKLILFPFGNLGKNNLSNHGVMSQKCFFSKTIIGFSFSIQPGRFLLKAVLNILLFLTQINLLLCLGQIIGDIHLYPTSYVFYLVIFGSVFIRYLLLLSSYYTEFIFRDKSYNYLSGLFSNLRKRTDKNEIVSNERLVGRDTIALAQSLSFMPDGVYLPFAFFVGTGAIYWISGNDGLVSILAIIAFIPLSFLIGERRKNFTKQVYKASKEKLDEINHWLDWRSYLSSWGCEGTAFDKVVKAIRNEIEERKYDSIWRSIDLYSIGFGKMIPTSLVILLSILAYPLHSGVTTVLWLTVPMIGVVITFSRFWVEVTQGQSAFDEIKQHLELSSETQAPSSVVLDEAWDIWEGTLAENACNFSHPLDPLAELNLLNEFSFNKMSLIHREGKNISSGQKSRILLARAINLSLASKLPLEINVSFHSLDPISVGKVLSCIEKMGAYVSVIWKKSGAKEHLLAQQALTGSSVATKNLSEDLTVESPKKASPFTQESPLFGSIFQLFKISFLVMLLPAICLSLIPVITAAGISQAGQLGLISAIGILGFASAVYFGSKIESSVREWALNRASNLLKSPFTLPKIDVFQRLSEDFRTVCERLAWYMHDGMWITSLFLIAAITSFVLFGFISVGLFVIWGSICVLLWNALNPVITSTRRATIQLTRVFLDKLLDVIAISTSPRLSNVKATQKKLSQEAFNSFYVSGIESDAAKFCLSSTLGLLSGLVLAFMATLGFYLNLHEDVFVLLIAAFLNVDYNIQMFVLALSGFNAQRIALDRLNLAGPLQGSIPSLIYSQNNSYYTPRFRNDDTFQLLSPYQFEKGKSYTLRSPSGSGKSIFLRSIAGISQSESEINGVLREEVVYLDGQARQILNWLSKDLYPYLDDSAESLNNFLENRINEGRKVIFLDEALTFLPLERARAFADQISNRISLCGGLLILVDHRFNLENIIPLQIEAC